MSDGGAGERALPPGWAWATLGELLVELRNGISTRPDEESGLRILRISAVRPRSLDLADVRYLPDDKGSLANCDLREGDLLFTRYNGNRELVGACAMVRGLSERTVYPDKLIRARVNRNVVEPAYLELAANHGRTRAFIESKAKTAAGQVGISGSDLRDSPVPLPPVAEQRRIVAKLDDLLARARRVRDILDSVGQPSEQMNALERAILSRAFRGELVPQDPSDEPASVMLERLRAATSPRASARPLSMDGEGPSPANSATMTVTPSEPPRPVGRGGARKRGVRSPK